MKICPATPSISHLLFADDSLILARANREEATQLQNILELYERCSGQMINWSKLAAFFSTNTRDRDREDLREVLHITCETMNEKYLGLPIHVGRSKSEASGYLKDRIWKRIQGWKEKFLSWAGKEVLIEAVAQAIPTFAMGCFDLTKELCDKISAMVCRYWWNQQGVNKVH